MTKINSGGLIPWNGGLLHRGTSHLNLWSDARKGSHRLGFWGHSDGEFFRKDEKKERKSSEFFLSSYVLDAKINEEEKSLMMTLERLLTFYRRNNWLRYTARISRSIVTRRVATRLERGPHVLKRTATLQAPLTCGNMLKKWISPLTEPRPFGKEKSVSLLWSLHHFDGVRTASLLRRPHLGKAIELCLNFNRAAFWSSHLHCKDYISSVFLRLHLGKTRELCLNSNKVVSLQ